MAIAIAGEKHNTGVAIAEVNLKLIWSVIASIRVGQNGYAYVRDSRERLDSAPRNCPCASRRGRRRHCRDYREAGGE